MRTYLIIQTCVTVISMGYLLFGLLTTKPKWPRKNRLIDNWREGGKIMFLIFLFGSVILSLAITKIWLWFNFLERIY